MKVKDMTKEQKARRALRRHLARYRRTYGLIGKVENCALVLQDGNRYLFDVTFSDRTRTSLLEVRLYAKSAKVYWV